jgi:hypothetical protein
VRRQYSRQPSADDKDITPLVTLSADAL